MRYSDIRDREASNILASDIDSSPVLTSALVEVIITEVVRTDPPRKVTQVWTTEGELIAERDPIKEITGDASFERIPRP